MIVYVVLSENVYGVKIKKIFTTKTRAEEYRAELKKQNPCCLFNIEEHWVI